MLHSNANTVTFVLIVPCKYSTTTTTSTNLTLTYITHRYNTTMCLRKMCKLWNGTAQNYKDRSEQKHANFKLEYFEYFCQMSSKSILILSDTVSKFAHFLRHSVLGRLVLVTDSV